ncbi:MAG TPA: sigma-70 family RNA polymerase sigma factor [Symbiobacteriaceae bacterium]
MQDLWLIYRCRHGDTDAFGALYQRHCRSVYRTALNLVRDPTIAEDITQEAFATAFHQIGSLRSAGAFRTWLYRIVVSRATRFLRAEGGERRPLSLEILPEGQSPVTQDPMAAAADLDELAALRRAVLHLEDDLRLPVLLHYYSGLPLAEVAAILAIPRGTVKSRLYTARRRLAVALGATVQSAAEAKELSI